MQLHPDYLTDADRIRIVSHWLTRTSNLMHEGVCPTLAPHAAAREMKLGEDLLRGWTVRLMHQALMQGQVSARLNGMKAGILATPHCCN
jgi:hypothetical protein